MVAITGYSVGAMLYISLAMYGLIFLIVATQWMSDKGKQLSASKLFSTGFLALIVTFVGQLFPIRIGTIMFVNGMLFAVFVGVIIHALVQRADRSRVGMYQEQQQQQHQQQQFGNVQVEGLQQSGRPINGEQIPSNVMPGNVPLEGQQQPGRPQYSGSQRGPMRQQQEPLSWQQVQDMHAQQKLYEQQQNGNTSQTK